MKTPEPLKQKTKRRRAKRLDVERSEETKQGLMNDVEFANEFPDAWKVYHYFVRKMEKVGHWCSEKHLQKSRTFLWQLAHGRKQERITFSVDEMKDFIDFCFSPYRKELDFWGKIHIYHFEQMMNIWNPWMQWKQNQRKKRKIMKRKPKHFMDKASKEA